MKKYRILQDGHGFWVQYQLPELSSPHWINVNLYSTFDKAKTRVEEEKKKDSFTPKVVYEDQQ